MRPNRAFLPQEALDVWLSDGRIELNGDVMRMTGDGRSFTLHSAVHFVRDVGGTGDQLGLLGKVKDLEQLEELGGEHCADSVIVGDEAYEVVEGFVGTLIPTQDADLQAGTGARDPAWREAKGLVSDVGQAAGAEQSVSNSDIDELSRIFLGR